MLLLNATVPCSGDKCTGSLDLLDKDLSEGIRITTIAFGKNPVSNHKLPILLSHSKNIAIIGSR